MSEKSAFSKGNLKTITIDHRDWLEQLNVPPTLAEFIRKNNKAITTGLVVIVLALIGWNFYTNYKDKQLDAAAAALATAMKETSAEARKPLLEKIIQDYSGLDVAAWAQIELGHDASSTGKHAEAVTHFKAVLAKLSSGNSIRPLVQYDLAAAQEAAGASDEAKKIYEELLADAPYAGLAQLALARLFEKTGDRDKAMAAYEKFLSATKEVASNDRAWAEERLANLKKTGSGSATPSANEASGK